MNYKNHIIISIDAEKYLTKFNIHLDQTLNKVHTEGMYLNTIKAVYDKSTVVITLNGKKLKIFLLRSGTR